MLIKVNVSTDIFESPKVKRQFDDIFEETKFLFLNRYEEMISVIAGGKNKKEYKSVISFEDVFKKFKEKFLEKVAALAVQTSFSCKNHNIKSNLISALTTENITKAITGETMIDAFIDVIREITPCDAWSSVLKGSKIFLLRKKFLEENPYKADCTPVLQDKNFNEWLNEDLDD